MDVLIDTSVWSVILRRSSARTGRPNAALEFRSRELVSSGRAAIIGPIRQELLTGIRSTPAFERLRSCLRMFPDEPLEPADYESAADHENTCGAAGLPGSPADFLICAVAIRRGWEVFTTDRDFQRYATVLPLRLHAAST